MRKFLSFIVLLAISSTLSFGQNLDVTLSTAKSIRADEANKAQSLDQYFNKNAVSNTKVTLLDQGFEGTTFPPTGWTVQNLTSDPSLQWTTTTYEHSGTKGAKIESQNPAVIARDEWLISPSMDLTTITNPCLIFYLGTSYHFSITVDSYDFRVRVSTDGGANWIAAPVWTEDSVGYEFDDWNYYKRWVNLADYASSSDFKIAFQYVGIIGADAQGAVYLDDITIEETPANNITVNRVTLHNAYTQVPVGLGRRVYYDAEVTNYGVNVQTNLKLHAVDLTTGADSTSIDTTLSPGESLIYINNLSSTGEYFAWDTDYFFDPQTVAEGTYKVTSYISSDSIPYLAQDTFDIKVVCDTCMYSRDNNTYTGWRYQGVTGGLCDPYTAANDYIVSQDKITYGVNFVVGGNSTRVGAKIRAVLYQFHRGVGYGTPVAQSDNYYIKATDIPQHVWHANPVSISLPFTSSYTLQADSTYLVGVQVYGGIDTVTIAADKTGIPQWEQESSYFDPGQNKWYVWDNGNIDQALMIRTVFNENYPWSNDVGIDEINNNVNLFSCMPNPANNTTKISYELKNSEKVSIFITDITGRTVQTINQGTQTKGNYSVDVDLSDLTSGTYFYTLKTPTAQATDKLIVVKR